MSHEPAVPHEPAVSSPDPPGEPPAVLPGAPSGRMAPPGCPSGQSGPGRAGAGPSGAGPPGPGRAGPARAEVEQTGPGWRAPARPRLALATVCLSGTLEDKLEAAATAGFDGVEIFAPDLVADPLSPAGIGDRCRDLGLSVDLYQPLRDIDSTDPDRFAANLRRAGATFDVMAGLGADTVLVCSSVAPDAVADRDRLAELLHRLAEQAHARGMRIAYEALAWGRHVDTWDASWQVVRDADHPALGLCLDSFHILARGSDPAPIADVPGEKLFFLQLADAREVSMDVLSWSRHHRLFPGQGGFDLPAFLAPVLAAGYAGPLSLEVFNDVFRQADPLRTAVDARRSLLALAEATALPGTPPAAAAPPSGGTAPPSGSTAAAPGITAAPPAHSAARSTDSAARSTNLAARSTDSAARSAHPTAPPAHSEAAPARAAAPHGGSAPLRDVRGTRRGVGTDPVDTAPPELAGPAFVELHGGPELGPVLRALGFGRTGVHRTKQVERYEQGGARLLVNAAGDGPSAVAAIGVESADPVASARRASRLCAPPLSRTTGPGEADLAEIPAPDGTSVFFCRTADDGGAPVWSHDFVAVDEPPVPRAGVTGIDHVGLTQPYDAFDEAVLFHRSVLGLDTIADGEFAAPFGLVRSRALADRARRVRLALTVSLLRRGEWGPAVADPQYVALACDDVLATARAARDAGAPLLAVPANYHDDLAARLELPDTTMAAYRELGVLHERDPGGDLLQVCTELLGGRLFLSLVQRTGTHDGHGWADAPVRMAAHRRSRLGRAVSGT
ncbi:4-hydroxyphenylpyruvate dioxygenase [Pseudonocardia ammonioxydans]|uniref:3-dehydroshikimate dehydratase n=2 Tax=Pseudonocardia ammonioxydans TaxID=260086 RepID=A0A1I4U0Q9_PSUAM|nr:4-hydroxyphenylpyruvate dioxygenase [Pseudonocardia ammonioxydans]